jgi:hypothetical protein
MTSSIGSEPKLHEICWRHTLVGVVPRIGTRPDIPLSEIGQFVRKKGRKANSIYDLNAVRLPGRAMVETPHAVMNIKEIGAASYVVPRMEALMMVSPSGPSHINFTQTGFNHIWAPFAVTVLRDLTTPSGACGGAGHVGPDERAARAAHGGQDPAHLQPIQVGELSLVFVNCFGCFMRELSLVFHAMDRGWPRRDGLCLSVVFHAMDG